MATDLKPTLNALKAHWVWFAIIVFVLVAVVLSQDAKRGGSISKFFAGLPLIGKLFTAFALLVGFGHAFAPHAARLLA
jgi:hypothetical protein